MPHSLAEAVFHLLDLAFHGIFSSTWPGSHICRRSTSEGGRQLCVHLTAMLSQCWYRFPHLFYGQDQRGDQFFRSPSSDTLFLPPLLSLCFFSFTFLLLHILSSILILWKNSFPPPTLHSAISQLWNLEQDTKFLWTSAVFWSIKWE